jgi:hypothetical protein
MSIAIVVLGHRSGTLLSYITSARLCDGSWKSGTNKCILHWEEQVGQYERLVEHKDHFSEAIKLHMLQNAVNAVPELRQVKIQADQLAPHTGKQSIYLDYVTLLYSASVQYDSQFHVSAGAKITQKRQVYNHEIDYKCDVVNSPLRHDKQLLSLHDVIQACHHLTQDPGDDSPDIYDSPNESPNIEGADEEALVPADILTFATNREATKHILAAHLAKMMSEAVSKHSSKSTSNTRKLYISITHYGTSYIVYSISCIAQVDAYGGAPVDGGSNGGLDGKEM